MPRAYSQVLAMLDRLKLVRENIQILQQTLQQMQATDGPSLKPQIDSEETRLNDLQAQIAKLNERVRPSISMLSNLCSYFSFREHVLQSGPKQQKIRTPLHFR